MATVNGQTDFAPLGGRAYPGDGPALPAARPGMVGKRFTVKRLQLEFRAEAFNVTNTANFQLPSATNFSNRTTFGQITATSNLARQIQLGMKVHW